MSLCGLPGCGREKAPDSIVCKTHKGLERFAEAPNLGMARRLNDATPAEWDAASATARRIDATAQPKPVPAVGPALWDLVTEDMRNRDTFGKHKYGLRLQAHNGRDFLADAYQEALDLAVYLRGIMYERDGR